MQQTGVSSGLGMEDPWLLHVQFAYPLSKSTKMFYTCRVRDTLETRYIRAWRVGYGRPMITSCTIRLIITRHNLWTTHGYYMYNSHILYRTNIFFIVQDAWNSRSTLPNMIYKTFRIITGHPYGPP